MTDTVAIEVHVLVDEDGNFVVDRDLFNLTAKYTENFGDVPAITRVYTLALTVPRPSREIICAAVEGEPGETELSVR